MKKQSCNLTTRCTFIVLAATPTFADSLPSLLDMPREPFAWEENFEENDPVELWESKGEIHVRFKGLTDESAAEGAKSFKLDVVFQTDGRCIWRIPCGVPLEGDMEMTLQWRTGSHCNADLLGAGYRILFAPTDTYYRRTVCSVRGDGLHDWQACSDNFGTPGWPDDSIVSETRAGPLSLNIAAPVLKYDLGVLMDPLIWMEGKAGQRAVIFVDAIRLEGEAPDRDTYEKIVRARYDDAAAPFYEQLADWSRRYERVLTGFGEMGAPPEPLQSSVVAQHKAVRVQRARLREIIEDRHSTWQRLDPVMDTLWAAEKSLAALKNGAGSEASPDLVHYSVRPISNTTVLPTEIPTVGGIMASISVAACRGEVEPAAFAVHALNELRDLRVEIGDLQGPETLPGSVVDPFVLKVWYRSGLYSGDPNGRWLLKELLLKDDALVQVNTAEQNNYVRHTANDGTEEYWLCSGPTSDHLEYLQPVDPDTLQPVTMPAGTSKSFWLTVHVPEDAASGDYEGTVTLRWAGGKSHRIPLRLTVHPFELPQSPLVYSVYNRGRVVGPELVDERLFLYPNSEEIDVERYEREIRNQVEHGVLHPNSYDTLDMARVALEARQRAGVATDRFFCLDLWRMGLAKDASLPHRYGGGVEGAMDKVRERVRAWQAITGEFGYDQVYFMGVDEARGDILAAERPVFEEIHRLGGKVWAAQTHETTFGVIGDLMDVAVMAGLAKPSEAKRWHGAGKEVFQYGGPMTEWDHPENYRRNQGLVLWQRGYDGMMHYAYRHGFTHVWNDFDNERRDHAFVLPVVDGLIDTIAWEGMREGIDDTRYVAALLEAIERTSHHDQARQAQTFLREMNLAAIMDEVRTEIVRWIENLQAP
jgi:hypothetical protein